VRSLYTVGGFVLLYFVSLGVWALAVRWAPPLSVRSIVALAIFMRLLMSVQAPALSGDAYRYIWDGKVAAAGMSPYALAPNNPKLASLREGWHGKINHPEIRTIYPPHAEMLFVLAQLLGGLFTWKLMLIAFDVVTITLLSRMTDSRTLLGYALFPLLLFEGFWSAHIEVAATTLLMLSVVWVIQNRSARAGIALAFATGFKVIPAAAFPALVRASRQRLLFVAGFVFALLLPVLPWMRSDRSFMPGFSDYAQRWSFNSPAYSTVFTVLKSLNVEDAATRAFTEAKDHLNLEWASHSIYYHLYTDFFTRVLLGVCALVAIGYASRKTDVREGVVASLGALLLFSPTIHPWYWLPLVPLAMVTKQRAWLALALLSPLSYLLYLQAAAAPEMRFIVGVLCYVPPALMALTSRPPASASATSDDEWHSAATRFRRERETSRR
jgi:alpha-1,6-mannosyltransferase